MSALSVSCSYMTNTHHDIHSNNVKLWVCLKLIKFNHQNLDYLLNVIPGFEFLQQQNCLLGLLVALNFVFNHQWDLWDFLNAVS